MNLILEEQILIKDIFDATVDPNDHSKTYLSEFAGIVMSLGDKASLVVHNSHFDSILFEKLRVPDTNILECLEDCWNRAEAAREKPWNSDENIQAFIKYSIDIIKNFVVLSL